MSRINLVDHDTRYQERIKNDETFSIDTDIDYIGEIDRDTILSGNSLFSYKFEIRDNYPPELIRQKYTCKCNNIIGQVNKGVICPKCESEVKTRHFPLIAYFNLGKNHKILNIVGLMFLKKLIGATNYERFLNGELADIDSAYKHWDVLLEKYAKKRPESDEIVDFLKKNKEVLFINKIPVLSSVFRYMQVSQNMGIKKIDLHDLNTPYTQLSVLINHFKEVEKMNTPLRAKKLLNNIQATMDILKEALIITFAGSKKKILRDSVYGTRIPYASISVLVPRYRKNRGDLIHLNDVGIPIESFRATFNTSIKKVLIDEMGYSPIQAENLVDPSYTLTKNEKELLKHILISKIDDPYLWINRQPTIDFECIEILNVKDITDELVIRLHPSIFGPLRADCDGDILLQIGLPEDGDVRKEFFDQQGPASLIINYKNEFNDKFGLKNDDLQLFTHAMSY